MTLLLSALMLSGCSYTFRSNRDAQPQAAPAQQAQAAQPAQGTLASPPGGFSGPARQQRQIQAQNQNQNQNQVQNQTQVQVQPNPTPAPTQPQQVAYRTNALGQIIYTPAVQPNQQTAYAPTQPQQIYRTQGASQGQPYSANGNGQALIAYLLPLSGPASRFGLEMQSAVQLAQQDFAGQQQIRVFDTQSSPQGAQAAAAQALASGAGIIFGPLQGSSVPYVVNTASRYSVPVVTFSTDLAQIQNGGIIGGIAPADSTSKILAYAGSNGLSRVVVLAPSNAYGYAAAGAALQVAPSAGVAIVDTLYYNPGRDATERTEIAKQVAQASDFYDAIFIPESGSRLKEVASLLAYHELDPSEKKILGTTIWDRSILEDEATLYGAWYAAPSSDRLRDFEARFKTQTGRTPSELAPLAYEAAEIASQMLLRYGGYSSGALANGEFDTLFGRTRFERGVVASRSMAIKQVSKSGKQLVTSTAPSVPLPTQAASVVQPSFEQGGYTQQAGNQTQYVQGGVTSPEVAPTFPIGQQTNATYQFSY